MSLAEIYQLYGQIREPLKCLGHWQALTLAVYCEGVTLAEKCIPSKVSGKAERVQRRLERWLDTEPINWRVCCGGRTRWVLSRYVGQDILLLVDATNIGQELSIPNAISLSAWSVWASKSLSKPKRSPPNPYFRRRGVVIPKLTLNYASAVASALCAAMIGWATLFGTGS